MTDRPIADYAVLGDGLSTALVSREGSIDWLCWPRFDSPAVLCRLLDAEKGGFLSLAPERPARAERRYLDGTAVLENTFRNPDGAVRVIDFAPIDALDGCGEVTPRRLVRRVEGLSGRVCMAIGFRPTFDFARVETRAEGTSFGAVASAGTEVISLRAPVPLAWRDGALRCTFDLAAGEVADVVLAHGILDPVDARAALARTESAWRLWADRCHYAGPWRELVVRSAITLKLLTYRPTGALIAAPTTSLPERPGGVRNWDYRFAWLRDAALALDALQDLGLHDEAMHFWEWLESLCLRCGCPAPSLYRVDGRRVGIEEVLDHLAGWRSSRPVRIGNAAAGQLQLDVYGVLVDAAWTCMRTMREPHPALAPVLAFLADRAASDWKSPDEGIWEVRDRRRHFVHSKLGCWLALDRAVRLVELGWLSGDAERWRSEREAVRTAILERGLDSTRGLVRAFDDRTLDASVLLASRIGFFSGDDPRMLATIDAIRGGLAVDGLLRRYEGSDGLPGEEGAFLPCSFWLVDALALAGRTDDASSLFSRLAAYANDVGLLSEEIMPATRELLGNFPQALSHLALIRSAVTLAAATSGSPTAIR